MLKREPKHRKAFNFDLDTKILETMFSDTRKPYSDIRKAMDKLEFDHRQYSGYNSKKKLTEIQVFDVIDKLKSRLPWLNTPGLIQKFDVTDIGKQYDLSTSFGSQVYLSKTNTPTPTATKPDLNRGVSLSDLANISEVTPPPTEQPQKHDPNKNAISKDTGERGDD
jgi:virulence-associated protein VapD